MGAPPKYPVVWIDLETTGNDPLQDTVLEIAVVITDNQGKNEVDAEGLQLVVKTDKDTLDNMHPDCIAMHGKSGLIDACLNSTHTKEDVVKQVMQYIKKWVPAPFTAWMGGSSIGFDRTILLREMPEITNYLKYQVLDVTSLMIATKALYFGRAQPQRPTANHRAMEDIRNTIEQYKYYLRTFFRPPQEIPVGPAPVLGRARTVPVARPALPAKTSQDSDAKNGLVEKHEPGGPVRHAGPVVHNAKPYDRT